MANPVRVLIIDDSTDDQLLYRRALAKGSETAYEFAEAESGESGLERIGDFAPDCVLLDYSLPGHNGIEVLKRLRVKHPFVPVAMLTGQGNETVAVAAMQEGAQNYISKSTITPEAIQRVVRVAIEHCGMQKHIHDQRISLEGEISVRRQAEKDAQAQLERLHLLHQITRAIGERQDLDSIFQVVIRSLEERLPVAVACLFLYEGEHKTLRVARVGAKHDALSQQILAEGADVVVDQSLVERCVRGELVYEAELSRLASPLAKGLADAGLRSLVLAPLQVESEMFGVLAVARPESDAFNDGEREFIRQLSEHVALAAHQVRLYGALQQAYDKLRRTQQAVMEQERLRAVGQMASGIAHDINNALSPVALYTQSLLETDKTLSPKAREYLETTQRAVEDVAHTVARLRDFYRQRETELSLSPVQLNQLVKHAVDLTRARWSDIPMQRGIVIEMQMELAANLPSVMGVEPEIREALVNLILNAVDALPEGGKLTVRTRAEDAQAGGRIRVDIADNGAGMDEETRKRCLEPFFTTKGERGTGLGLAMVYGIAQRHNAEVAIDSALGQGTTVSMKFMPAADGVASAAPAPAVDKPASLRLLLVDDDPLVLQSLKATLEVDGHTVVAVNGGQAGIDTFKESMAGQHFAAVVTDLGMPHVDGHKVAAAVKELSAATPVILLTGWGNGFQSDGDLPPGISGMLGKPPKLRDIRAALTLLCNKTKQRNG